MHFPEDITHIGYADESNWNTGRFRSIALVSMDVENAQSFDRDLGTLCNRFHKHEFKWQRIREQTGKALVDFSFDRIDRMRVDVLVWDMQDARRKDLVGRDDKADFGRMYFHILRAVMAHRWLKGSRWMLCADRQSAVDWPTLEDCLAWKSREKHASFLPTIDACDRLGGLYDIVECREVDSRHHPLVQLADFFAGLVAFSYLRFNEYLQWKEQQSGVDWLFDPADHGITTPTLSASDKQRFPVLLHLKQRAAERRLRLSLESSRGLRTHTPKDNLNCWLYTPQHPDDKAPTRNRTPVAS